MTEDKTLLKLYNAHIEQLKARGEKLDKYLCPHCKGTIDVLVPPSGQVFDTMATCPHCLKLHFRIVYSSGEIEIKS
jgi:hypothetical protein